MIVNNNKILFILLLLFAITFSFQSVTKQSLEMLSQYGYMFTYFYNIYESYVGVFLKRN